MGNVCNNLRRSKRSEFSGGPISSRSARQAGTTDVENPRHVVDRAESDKSGYRSGDVGKRLWPGGEVLYKLDDAFSK